jgi:hypothetical protein
MDAPLPLATQQETNNVINYNMKIWELDCSVNSRDPTILRLPNSADGVCLYDGDPNQCSTFLQRRQLQPPDVSAYGDQRICPFGILMLGEYVLRGFSRTRCLLEPAVDPTRHGQRT